VKVREDYYAPWKNGALNEIIAYEVKWKKKSTHKYGEREMIKEPY